MMRSSFSSLEEHPHRRSSSSSSVPSKNRHQDGRPSRRDGRIHAPPIVHNSRLLLQEKRNQKENQNDKRSGMNRDSDTHRNRHHQKHHIGKNTTNTGYISTTRPHHQPPIQKNAAYSHHQNHHYHHRNQQHYENSVAQQHHDNRQQPPLPRHDDTIRRTKTTTMHPNTKHHSKKPSSFVYNDHIVPDRNDNSNNKNNCNDNDDDDDDDDDTLELPYAQSHDPLHIQRASNLSNVQSNEPLRVYDVVAYYHPMYICGNKDGYRVSQVIQIYPQPTSSTKNAVMVVELDNGDVFTTEEDDDDESDNENTANHNSQIIKTTTTTSSIQIRRIMEYHPRERKMYPHPGITRPLHQFRCRPGKINATTKAGIDRQVEKLRAIVASARKDITTVTTNPTLPPLNDDDDDDASTSSRTTMSSHTSSSSSSSSSASSKLLQQTLQQILVVVPTHHNDNNKTNHVVSSPHNNDDGSISDNSVDDDDDDNEVVQNDNSRSRTNSVSDEVTLSRQLQQQQQLLSSISSKPPNSVRLSLTKQNRSMTQFRRGDSSTPKKSLFTLPTTTIHENDVNAAHHPKITSMTKHRTGRSRLEFHVTPHQRGGANGRNNTMNDVDEDEDALPPQAFPPSASLSIPRGAAMKTKKADVLSKQSHHTHSDDDCDSDDTDHLLQYRSTRKIASYQSQNRPPHSIQSQRSTNNATQYSMSTTSSVSTNTASTTIRPKVKSFLKVSPEFKISEWDRPHGGRRTTTIRRRNSDLDSCKLQLLQPQDHPPPNAKRPYDISNVRHTEQQRLEQIEEYNAILRDHDEFILSQQSSTTSRKKRPLSKKPRPN